MNKRGLIKLSIYGIILIIFLLFFNAVFLSEKSSAIPSKDYYNLGESIKIDLREFSDYRAKIATPSTSFIRKGSNDIFVYKPTESGNYLITVESSTSNYSYYFEVREEINQNSSLENSSMQNNYNFTDEDIENYTSFDTNLIEKIPANLKLYSSKDLPTFEFSNFDLNLSESSIIESFVGIFTGHGSKIYTEGISGERNEISGQINVEGDKFDINIEDVRSITPGLNKLVFVTYKDGEKYTAERWFLWGILAINFDRSYYKTNGESFISIGVLSDSGSIVCDADLTIYVTDPNGNIRIMSTQKGDIQISSTCDYLGVTSFPDYYADIHNLISGSYSINLTAETENGIYSIIDGFEVKDYLPFEVRRDGPTRVYPYMDQRMKIFIKANENYTGEITDLIPRSFDITNDPEIERGKYDDYTDYLKWDVELIGGEYYEFSYEFDTPNVSPELYFLGPLNIGDFYESRKWQIANDAEVTIDGSIAINDEQYGTGSAVVFLNDTTGYAFYFDAGPQLSYVKSTNGGTTWGSPVAVTAQADAYTFAIWYDKWTPSYNGTLINIVFGETGGDAFYYKALNTTGDTLTTEVDATGDIGRLRESAQNPSIARASSGNLFFSGADDLSGNEEIWKSTNNGSSWATTSASAFNNDFNDEFALIPIPGGDIFAIHADDSAADLIARRYNETTDAWIAGVTIDTTFEVSTTQAIESSWGATLDPNKGYIYVAGNNNPGVAGADLQSYFYNGTNWSTTTDVYTNINAAGRGVKLSFGSNNNTVYATYTRAPGGTATSSDVYKVSSADNMTTWSSEIQVSTTQDDLMHPRPDLVNSQRIYTTWVNNNLNDFLGNSLVYISPSGPQGISGNYFSTGTVTSVAVTPMNYSSFAVAWCDDAADTINVALYYTNGTGITNVVDSSAGACTANSVGNSVSITGLNTTAFLVAWYDSVDSDITFKVYNATLGNITADTDVDTDAGTSVAVSTSAFNSSSFVIGWYDGTDQDSTFRTYSTNGVAISAETDVDTTAGTASNAVAVSALNSTVFMFAWFDDIDNDASLQAYNVNGGSLAAVFDADGGAGESRAVTVSAFNSTSVVFGWYDQATTDASFRIHQWNATPISVGIDADADIGTARSLAVATVAEWRFGMDWYDASVDTGVAAQTFYFNTSDLSTEITVQSASQQYADIASQEYSTGLELCEDAFVVAVANTTSQNFWKLYLPNGTIWDGNCSTNYPVISNVNASATTFSAIINWSTDVYANSTVNYGTTTSLGTVIGNSFTELTHTFNITGLSAGLTYYYNVTSCIDGRCNTSGTHSFSTGIGDPTPVIGKPINGQIWTNGTNVLYVLNFTNNGTVMSNYTVNVTNITGANYVTLNQSTFTNINNGTTVYFEVNLSSTISGNYLFAVNVTSTLDTTKKDGTIIATRFFDPYVFSNNSVTSVSTAVMDYNKIVTAWCDDIEDDISFGVFNTSGYLLTQITDVDTTAGACTANGAGHSVAVTALNSNLFAIAWYDSGNSDTTFQLYYTNGTIASSATDMDTDATAALAVSVTPLNSTAFVTAWYDDTSNDISAAVYSNTGSTITSIFDIDTNVGEAAQAVEVSAVNSTAFGVTYFDDSGAGGGLNDLYYVLYSYTGVAISSVITLDANGGNSRSISLAVMNESSIAISWVDVNDGVKAYTVLYPNGTTRIATRTIDPDSTGGEDVRVSALTQDDFVISWYDPTTDIGTYAQTFMNNGSNISSQITVQSSTQQYNDVASEEFTTQIQLCENAYAVSFVNTTTQALWKAYYPNGTIWNGVCPTYVPQIQNVNVTAISITSAFVNWSTDVEANSSIIYGTSLALSAGSNGNNFPENVHGFNLTGLNGQTIYYYNVTSCIDGRCNTTGPHNFTTSTVDITNPFVSLVHPSNGSTITNPFDYYFVYNVTDASTVSNCSLYIDGVSVETVNNIAKNVNQTFYHYLNNGTYLWAVSCVDQYGNSNITSNRTVSVNVSPWSFSRRLYETYTSSGATNETSIIWLNNSQDSTQNTVGFNLTAQTNVNFVNSSTYVMGSNGALIPGGSIADFSSSFSLSSANILITWKVYITNSSGSTLICQVGDDSNGGTTSAGTTTGQNTTCISGNVRLGPSDRITYVIDAFNNHATQVRSFTHAWDSPTSSYLDLNISTEGFLNVNLTSPAVDSSISTGQQMNVTCNVTCSIGTCRNTLVYIQRNSSTENWTNINSSGNIILSTGETNGHGVGNISTAQTLTNFSIQGNINSVNNIRCAAISTYDSINGTTTRQITVGQSDVAPVIELTNPSNATWYSTNNVTVFYNITDVNLNVVNSTVILNGVRNATNSTTITLSAINNFTLSNLIDGLYTWTVNATDSTNLEGTNTSVRSFYVDTAKPLITLSAPINASIFQVSTVQFNYTSIDNLDSSLVCNLTIDAAVVDPNIASANGTLMSRTISSISVGTHYWNVTCIDEAGNINTSITQTFTILDIAPTVELITTNATYSTNGNITLVYNVTDNNGLRQTRLIINGQANLTNQTTVLNGQYNNFTLLSLSEGYYTWDVNATDTGGLNATNGSVRTFIVDKFAPNVTLNLPANVSTWNSSTLNFNFTAIDTVDTSLFCNLTVGDRTDLNFAAINGSVTNRQLTGLIDGGHLWNVTCVDDAGNFNTSSTRLVNITEYPTITLNTANNTFFNTTTFNLTYTPSDNTNLSLCELYLDGSYNQTHVTPINGARANFTLSGVNSGAHTWRVVCNDTYDLTNTSQIRTFTVDTDGLSIDLIYPPNNTQFFSLTLNLSFNVTDDIDPTLLCNITVNSVVVNTSLASSGSIINRSITFASGGLKEWNVTCFDDASNRVTSETRNFTIEQAPSVALVSPSNNTFSNSSSIAFVYNVLDDNNNTANATLILNGVRNQTNITTIINDADNNITISLPDGFYNWTINVTDLTNLQSSASSEYTLTIDTQKPWIVLNEPANNSIVSSNNITFNYTAYDLMDNNLTCNLSIDDVVSVSNIASSNGTDILKGVIRSDGTYIWDVRCYDDANNLNISEVRTFTVEAPPLVTSLSPTNEQYLNSTTVNFVYRPEDAIGIFNCSLFIDGVINSSSSSISANVNNSFNVQGVTEGRHNWNVTCFDVFPDFNYGDSNLSNFTVDVTLPSITLNNPINNSNTLRLVSFNFTATDNIDTNLSCNLYTDNILNVSSINAPNGTSVLQNVNRFSLGAHLWNVTCVDDAGNRNWSSKFSFNVTLADFMINYTDIVFNATNPIENDTVMVNATIHNLINVTVPNVTVSFFQGVPGAGGIQLGSNYTIYDVLGLSDNVLSINWSVPLGTNQIYVHIDSPVVSNGTIEEWNETNNAANSSATVSGWQFVYGDMNGASFFKLAGVRNLSVVVWDASNSTNGTVYVADSESSISWYSVYAIGRNSTGSTTSNDFSDIDTLLSMSSFGDSVSNIFTTGGNPTNTANISIFNKFVNNVPLANSTNNTNFRTGMLWDGSDDIGDGQYSQDDKEDLIFMTSVNKNQPGAYGTYDYEIRIPAKLREYFTSQANRVVFYTEVI